MNLKIQVKKSFNFIFWWMDKLAKKSYVKYYPRYLRWLGSKIDCKECNNTWISPTVFLDSAQYDLIEIGKDVTISFGVTILVHDFSIKHAARIIGKENEIKSSIRKPVKIGNNVFIGAKSLILPGTTIGDDCIIGGGSVVKGNIETGSIYAGNPARKIGTTLEYAEKYLLDSV